MKVVKDGRYHDDLALGEIRKAANPSPRRPFGESPLTGAGRGSDLDGLADQLSAIARELRRVPMVTDYIQGHNDKSHQDLDEFPISATTNSEVSRSSNTDEGSYVRAVKAEAAREIYAQRRRRTALFGNPDLFGEPAWDILLDLYIAEAEGKSVSVSSACIGSAAPSTTGLRWLGVLAENDLILREHDPEDQRRVLVRLSDRGQAAMDAFLSGL